LQERCLLRAAGNIVMTGQGHSVSGNRLYCRSVSGCVKASAISY
jgi:hypothetical protein